MLVGPRRRDGGVSAVRDIKKNYKNDRRNGETIAADNECNCICDTTHVWIRQHVSHKR